LRRLSITLHITLNITLSAERHRVSAAGALSLVKPHLTG
tara:strand:+ start:486 stop:602 length:117 start_codon:yes stop_codon:yes gene_type:complete